MARITAHAYQRAVQRAIPPLLVCLLIEFGTRRRVAGGIVRYFDGATREKLRRDLRELLGRWDSLGDAFAVLDPDARYVVTLGHRTRRQRRP